jgi:hypothetical protein
VIPGNALCDKFKYFFKVVVSRMMSIDVPKSSPRDGFRNFLERAENDSWIASYRWFHAESFGSLKKKMGLIEANYSRTHKRGTDGIWWGLEVEAHEGTCIGVDLEIMISRPLLDDPEWITTRLNIPRGSTSQKIMEEWSNREAAFKSFAPDNSRMLLSQFRRTAPHTLGIFAPEGERSAQVRTHWAGRWVVSLAWRSLNGI